MWYKSGMQKAKNQRCKPDNQKAIGYIRVSTEEQHLGPEAQRDAMKKWCKANNKIFVAVFSDLGISGGAPIDKRPGLISAIESLKEQQAGILLVAKRDRLARDVVIAAMIERLAERTGAKVLTTDGTGNGDSPEAMLLRGIVDVFAQYERALIRSRTKAGLAVKKNRNERRGGLPFGFRLAGDGLLLTQATV
ncbi:MAG: recombinase family protein [Deltaproteobacteria bacterium]|nr:recombinase family protein [Deltaproteobacteria bacterium]